ncbi:hypothetical protein GTY65_36495 [Streptomyces sp. SID8379]|nr:hypothetical protein [Streptomyces sp. SID8379]
MRGQVKTAAESLRNAEQQVNRLIGESSYWQGDAATAFREALDGDMPTYLKNAARSLEKAEVQLRSWYGSLTSNRDLARKYDDEAGQRKTALDKAKQREASAGENPDFALAGTTYDSDSEAAAAQRRLDAANNELRAAQQDVARATELYDEILVKAKQLEGNHANEASIVAKSLESAPDKLAPSAGILESIGSALKSVGNFLLEHAGTIGAVAGILALFPTPLTPLFAGIALVASATSMAKNFSDPEFRSAIWGDKFGWNMDTFSAYASVVGDGIGMIPGAGALGKAGSEVASAARMAEGYGEVVTRGAKVAEFAKDIVPAFSREATEAAASSAAAGGAKRLAEISANGVNVVANIGSSVESEGGLPDDGVLHNISESSKAGATLHSVASLIGIA